MDVYAYGMTLLSTIHLLDGPYPEKDTYQEIRETHRLPGGEAANAALLLAKWGLTVKLDGPDLGAVTEEPLSSYFKKAGIDVSGMRHDPSYGGLEDLVLADGISRTVFGVFRRFLFEGPARWPSPDETAIREASVVLLDPFFKGASRRTAEICAAGKKPFVTIDCAPGSFEQIEAAATVVSGEYLNREFPGEDRGSLFRLYLEAGKGLTVFTSGAGAIRYGRRGGKKGLFDPFRVDVQGTLGAGDSFRAGILYGVFKGWSDPDVVAFAAATAACVCRRFPVALYPPSLHEINALMASGGEKG